jgi:hypothetical protein
VYVWRIISTRVFSSFGFSGLRACRRRIVN